MTKQAVLNIGRIFRTSHMKFSVAGEGTQEWELDPSRYDTCYILGAGASRFYDPYLPEPERPPLGSEFLGGQRARSLLGRSRYAELRLLCHSNPAGVDADIETILEHVAQSVEQFVDEVQHPSDSEETMDWIRRMGLGEFYFFVFELFRDFSLARTDRDDNYCRLARHWSKRPFAVVTLNYDLLFEQAIEAAGLRWGHIPFHQSGGVPILKVHGSINWFNPARGLVRVSGGEDYSDTLLRGLSPLFYDSEFRQGKLKVVSIRECLSMTVERLVRSSMDCDVPALLPPFGLLKNYSQVAIFPHIWRQVAEYFAGASRLVLIGTSLREQDEMLRSALGAHVRPNTEVTVVSSGRQVLERFRSAMPQVDPTRFHFAGTFDEYCDTL